MDDFDIYDYFSGDSYVSPGIPIGLPDIIFNPIDYLDNIDFSDAINFGDVLSGLDNVIDFSDAISFGDLGGITSLDVGDMADAFTFGDLGDVSGGIEGFGDVADLVGEGASGISGIEGFGDVSDIVGQGTSGISGIEGFGDISDIVGQGATGITGIEGFGDVSDIVGQGATGITGIEGFGEVADEVGQGATGITGIEGFGEAADEVGQGATGITGIEGFGDVSDEVYQGSNLGTDPYEIDGRQGSRTEGTALTETRPGGTEVIKPDGKKPDTKADTKPDSKTETKTEKTLIERLFGGAGAKDQALLMALLGGLLGLLGRGSAPTGPAGYQGGIPRYTAQRRPGQGTRFIRAAGGGLMDLAAGGQPARYLRGGTDGMADKIKTSIDGKQPARLSHGEFVIPADVVSHLGNGNSDAGADVLYDMMAKVRKARTGNSKQGKQINPRQYTPA